MRDGYPERIRQFYLSNRQQLFVYALSLTGLSEAAEDAVQSAFGRLLRHRFPPRSLRPYVYRCIRNAAIDEMRCRGREQARERLFMEDAETGTETPEADEYNALMLALERLSQDERESITLKLWSGLSFREIAESRRVSTNTAASWYRRGLAKMRSQLEEIEP